MLPPSAITAREVARLVLPGLPQLRLVSPILQVILLLRELRQGPDELPQVPALPPQLASPVLVLALQRLLVLPEPVRSLKEGAPH